MIMFLAYLLPLEQNQRLLLGIFDLAVVIILAVDYYSRLSASPNKRNFLLRQWDELPAMIPIIVFAFIDTSSVLQFIRFLTIFRIVRLYRILYLLKGMGGELVAFAGISGMSIIFGAFAIFIAEEGMPDSAINNMYDALWWSVETITTVAYGDYVPVTPLGKTIASFMMFAAIAFLWTFIRLLGNMIITRRVKKQKQEEEESTMVIKY
jgi:voltage-gated potassium channel